MCERLSELREALQGYSASFDPALLSGADAAVVVGEAATIEAVAANLKAAAAARLAETGAWRAEGHRSAAHHLARTTGTSVGSAAESLGTARKLKALPRVAAAARRGELSAQQTSIIADAAAADPRAQNELVSKAKKASLGELRDAAARVKAAAEPDPDARHRRIQRARSLRSYTDRDGAWHLHLLHTPDVGARIMARLAPVTDRLFRAARAEGRREALEAYGADAITEVLLADEPQEGNGPQGGDGPQVGAGPQGSDGPNGGDGPQGGPQAPRRRRRVETKVIVRIDFDSLLRGYAAPGDTCEIVGFGPVPVSVVRDMVQTEDPFLAAVVTKGEQVQGVVHLGRRPNAKQRTALEWLFPACTVRGCCTQSRLETDHRLDWADSHITLLELLDRFCEHHHDLKTNEGWALVEGTGKRDFVAPHDPRHPRYKPPPAEAADPPDQDPDARDQNHAA